MYVIATDSEVVDGWLYMYVQALHFNDYDIMHGGGAEVLYLTCYSAA